MLRIRSFVFTSFGFASCGNGYNKFLAATVIGRPAKSTLNCFPWISITVPTFSNVSTYTACPISILRSGIFVRSFALGIDKRSIACRFSSTTACCLSFASLALRFKSLMICSAFTLSSRFNCRASSRAFCKIACFLRCNSWLLSFHLACDFSALASRVCKSSSMRESSRRL